MALFDEPPRGDFATRLRSYSGYVRITSGADEPELERVAGLARNVAELCEEHRPTGVWVEVPAKAGAYKRNRGKGPAMADGMRKLHMAIGAVVAGATLAGVRVVPCTSGVPKEKRHAALQQAEQVSRVQLPRGARGGILWDVWDAIYLGMLYAGREP